MPLADTHCHLDLEAFDPDLDAVVERARHAGVDRCLVPALSIDSARRAIALAERFPDVYAAVGIHPTEIRGDITPTLEELRDLAQNPRVVAFGEIGLDYYWITDGSRRKEQRAALGAQMRLAAEIGKPVVLHMREEGDALEGDCSKDLLAILKEYSRQDSMRVPIEGMSLGVLHSFSGSLAMARNAIELGYAIGVTGPITYRRAQARRELVANIPLEYLLTETDSPFLAPEPVRGRRNEPAFVGHIADRIAQVQSRASREVAEVTSSTAARLFSWGESG